MKENLPNNTLTEETVKQAVSHFYTISLLSHLGSGKEEKWDTGNFSSEETASVLLRGVIRI